MVAGRRQRYAAWPAPKQLDPEPFLERIDAVTDRARRQPELLGGFPEAFVPGGGFEQPKRRQRRKLDRHPGRLARGAGSMEVRTAAAGPTLRALGRAQCPTATRPQTAGHRSASIPASQRDVRHSSFREGLPMWSRRSFLSSTLGAAAGLTMQGVQQAPAQTPAARGDRRRLIVDAQVHLWRAETPERPWVPGMVPQLPEPFTIEKLLPMMEEAGGRSRRHRSAVVGGRPRRLRAGGCEEISRIVSRSWAASRSRVRRRQTSSRSGRISRACSAFG